MHTSFYESGCGSYKVVCHQSHYFKIMLPKCFLHVLETVLMFLETV